MIRKTATVLAAAACLALAGCSADTPTDTTAATSPTTSSSTSAPATSSAPASGTLGAEDQAYLAQLIDGGVDTGFVAANGPRLVNLGQGVCADYRKGVTAAAEATNIINVLLAEAGFESDLAGSPQVRKGQAALAAVTVSLAARRYYCPDVTPA